MPPPQVRKGMALVDPRLRPAASWTFDADVAILTHSTTIAPRYQAVIHCEIIRQAAKVIAMDTERLRSGDRWEVVVVGCGGPGVRWAWCVLMDKMVVQGGSKACPASVQWLWP